MFVAVLVLAAMGALSLAGAGTAAKPASASSTPRAASSHAGAYLVRQVGFRNYAGPNCPGKGWNCTTSTRVLQIATAGGSNTALCTIPSCNISQNGTTNTARCTQSSGAVPTASQSCTISQTGATNYAFVTQSIGQSLGFTQLGKQTANVTQSGATNLNQLQLSQTGNQSTKVGTAQMQDVFQSAVVSQCAGTLVASLCTPNGTSTNFSSMTQSQLQKAYARGTTQKQDTLNLPSGFTDCVALSTDTPNSPENPNICADVQQHSDAGTNENHLRQSINEDMNSTGQSTQQQGHPDGGIDSHVHQDTVSASSLNDVNQSKNQHATAASGSPQQVQYDPLWCCGFGSQFGGTGNSESINQSSSLSASGPFPDQHSELIGTSRSPDGTCAVTQHASDNEDSANNSDSESPCPFLRLTTSCGPPAEDRGGSCFASPPDTSNPFPPDSAITLAVKNLSHSGEDFTDQTSALPGDILVYRVTYTNSGSGAAHNVTLSTEGIPPNDTALHDANLFDNVNASVYCPQTVSLGPGGTCTLGPAADPGTVAPGTDPLFTTMYFAVEVVTAPNCSSVSYSASGHTDEEGTVASNPTTIHAFFPCIK
jgi:uncharacterized repeat protein (TIGR01451 family)